MLVTVFKYEVANASSHAFSEDADTSWYKKARIRLTTPEEIEEEISDFCRNKDIVDIKVNTVDVHHHNNGRGNTVELWYTILYN